MKIVTARDEIRAVPDEWKKAYKQRGGWLDAFKQEKHTKLLALDLETATAADIAAIIGNTSWAQDAITCCECGIDYEVVVRQENYGEFGDAEHLDFCYGCIVRAFHMFNEFYDKRGVQTIA